MLIASRAHRAGFTLPEFLVVVVLLGVLGGVTTRVVMRQQQFYRGATEMMTVRTNLRELGGILPTDLRGLSSVGGDIYAMSDSAIEFRLPAGNSIVCSIGPGRLTMVVPPTALVSRSDVTAWLNGPRLGDSLFVYDEGAGPTTSDDTWQLSTLSLAPTAGVCPTSSGYTGSLSEATAALTLTLASALNTGVVPGSVIRFFRHARYKLFQPSTGSGWYLGYVDCPGGVCGALQAVAGPFLPYSATASATGLRLVYRDSTDAVTTTRANVARIDITARKQTANTVQMPGGSNDYYLDSLVVSVALRNR